MVELDYPMQKHLTDVHKDMSALNEQFLFDITPNSEELSFSIYDRAKDYGSNLIMGKFSFFEKKILKINFILDDLIGEAVVPASDLYSSVNSKRVIQLHKFGQTKTGSITAEVFHFF